jgi:hypothetical protein
MQPLHLAVAQENASRTLLTNTDKYGLVLNGHSLCTESVTTNLLLPSERAAARNF